MSIATDEHAVLDGVPTDLYVGGEWRPASGGDSFAVEDPATGKTLCEIADATPEDAVAALDAAVDAQAEWAATAPNERGEILWRAFEALRERADELALLMTLEMGKSVAESKAEITYSAEFFRWFSGEALRIDGNYKIAGNAPEPRARHAPAGRALVLHHALELPDRDGHAEGRPGDRRRLHDGLEAGPADAALGAGAGEAPRGRGPSAWGPEHRHELVLELGRRAGHRRPPASQAQLHGLDRGGPQAHRAVGRERAQGVDGAGRQRSLPDLRGRRPRRRGRGRDDREDAEHRRGLHVGQPLPRRRVRRRRVHRAPRRADGRAQASAAAPRRASTSGR